MKTAEQIDQLNYEYGIRKAFPNGLVRLVKNFDDVYFGWEICPKPGDLIIVRVRMEEQFDIWIERFHVNYNGRSLQHAKIWDGGLPVNEDEDGPDMDFLINILKNYDQIG